MDQRSLLQALLMEVDGLSDCAVDEVIAGELTHLVAVQSRALGLASWAGPHPVPVGKLPPHPLPRSAKELSQYLLSDNSYHASMGLAALNSLLPPPPHAALRSLKVQDLLVQYGRGKNVAVVGHFPFVERMGGEFAEFWVLEKRLRPGDLPVDQASLILPRADLVAITSTTLANGTLAEILRWTPKRAKRILLGPSTPLSAALFECGLDVLGGVVIEDCVTVKDCIRKGCSFKELQGAKYVVWESR